MGGAVLRRNLVALNVYIRKEEKSENNDLLFYLKKLQRERIKPKVSRSKEIIKIRSEINRKQTEKNGKTKRWFFENDQKVDKSLFRLTKTLKD